MNGCVCRLYLPKSVLVFELGVLDASDVSIDGIEAVHDEAQEGFEGFDFLSS